MQQKNFDQDIIDFAEFVKNMQWKRERCDYSYGLSPNINAVRNDIGIARGHLVKFYNSPETHRRAFSVYLLFKDDRHEKKFIPV